MARFAYEFKDFSGGEWGRLESWNAPKNTFTAKNMIFTRTGALCVRPGLKQTTPSGDQLNGEVWAMSSSPGDGSLFYAVGTGIDYFDPSASAPSVSSGTVTLAGTPSILASIDYERTGLATYFTTETTDGVFSWDGSTATELTGSPFANGVALFGETLVVIKASEPYKIKYTALGNFNSWPSANELQIGDQEPILAIRQQRTHLVVLKYSGIWLVTGTLTTAQDAVTVRKVSNIHGPADPRSVVRAYRDQLWYMGGNEQYPMSFDGSYVRFNDRLVVPDLPVSSIYTGQTMAASQLYEDPNGVYMHMPISASLSEGLLFANGVWTRHQFALDINGQFVARTVAFNGYSTNTQTLDDIRSGAGVLTFTDGGAVATEPEFYSWSPLMDRPGCETNFATESLCPERAGDASASQVAGQVSFPEHHFNTTEEGMVRTVVVDFRTWNTGSSTTNHFDLRVDSLRPYDNTSPVSSVVQSFDEAVALSSGTGTKRRKVFSFGDQGWGNGFQIHFTNVRGLEIQRYQVMGDTQPLRGF